ncbi:DNA-directed RNA polymerase subunit beta [Paenibacillus abyssi]|uniref:DNA-directed RNA polymerase subunit beta n=1 Tax=Paenibacillus abyssi TaxID=1340531 RepID=A0A917FNI4_9BACL|nr:DNA-directed RNA polymerase subunit beta [Paenibacillus abyssi]GGF91685.1 hypothetical protein GCM10010916_06270 [Paenibacillus abyssi]
MENQERQQRSTGLETKRIEQEQPQRTEGAASEQEAGSKQQRSKAARVFLWFLRKSIVPLLLILALIGGLYAGYVFIGNGSGDDVFRWDTWRHMYDLVFSDS